jgi:hypothetical protein
VLGWELLLSLSQWIALGALQVRYMKKHRAEPWHWMGMRILFNQLASLPVIVSGLTTHACRRRPLLAGSRDFVFANRGHLPRLGVLLVEILR